MSVTCSRKIKLVFQPVVYDGGNFDGFEKPKRRLSAAIGHHNLPKTALKYLRKREHGFQ